MELANNALQISREGIEFKHMLMANIEPSTRCYQLFSKLSQCVLTNKLNILDKDGTHCPKKPCDRPVRWRSGEASVRGQCNATTSRRSTAAA